MKAVAFVVLLTAGVAIAEPDLPDVSGPIPDYAAHVEIGAGVTAGAFEAGSTGDVAMGAEAHLGLRFDRFIALMRGAMLSLKQPGKGKYDPDDGYAVRGGGDLRYSVLQDRVISTSKSGRPVATVRRDIWIGAGAGYESVHWAPEGQLVRPYVDLGIGYEVMGRIGPAGQSYGALDLAIEVLAAKAPVSHIDPTLTGATDHSVMFTMTFSFGS